MSKKKPQFLAIIPARGGSKGVPRKNIRMLADKPLVCHTIQTALGSQYLDRIIVSTDDKEIAKISIECSAEVPFMRPEELARDETATEPVLQHVVEWLNEKEGYCPEYVVLLQPTSPFLDSAVIDQGIEIIQKETADSLLSVVEDRHFYWKLKDEQIQPEYTERKRRQELTPKFRENGALYITKREILMKLHNRLGGKIAYVIMEEIDSIEIDTEFDFWLAEKIAAFKRIKRSEGKTQVKGK
ncbi:MAG: acylneuraminate cytidylyltransferase family protein [Candidatus Hermodarchaeota archaeon]|nr:acylneuraminate cytidylyltransferase family protein [Candidatus Hermodarchaeota archaeon]